MKAPNDNKTDQSLRHNNLNFVRLLGAALVLYGHSFSFLGLPAPLFLSWLPLGALGVYIFFTISGYLIVASWEHDPHLVRFLTRRALRIFPALAICIMLSVLVVGPLLTTRPLSEYFSSEHTWGYFRNIALYISYYLPGVFEHNRVPNAVNGSLWSLPIEFSMYLGVALLGMVNSKRWPVALVATVFALVTFFWALQASQMVVVYASDVRQIFLCGIYFWAGAVFYKFNLQRYFSITLIVIACIALICLEPWVNLLAVFCWVLLPTIVLAFGLAYSQKLTWIVSTGDYSYGIYIYAFPIQQTVVSFYPDMAIEMYVPICFALSVLFASLSWHLIEKPALALKPRRPKNQIVAKAP